MTTLATLTTLTAQSLAAAAGVGAAAGTHAAIWGMYKDAVHEGFTAGRFVRSIVVGAAAGTGMLRSHPDRRAGYAGWSATTASFGRFPAVRPQPRPR